MLSLTTAALPIVHLQRSRLRRCLSTMSRNMASVTAHVFVLWTVTIIRHLLQTATSTSSDSSTLLSLALTTCAASIHLDWLYYRQSATIGCSCSLLTCSTSCYLLARQRHLHVQRLNSRIHCIHCHLSYSLRFIVSLCPTVCQSCDNYTVPRFNVQLSCYRSTGVLSYFRLFSVQQTRPIIFNSKLHCLHFAVVFGTTGRPQSILIFSFG